MIISDTEYHKINLQFKEDNFMILSGFHLDKKSSEWKVKVMGFSPEAQLKIAELIADKYGNKIVAKETK